MLKLDPVAITDVGRRRTHNEDFLGDLIFKSGRKYGADKLNERGYLFAVADGMGGHASGEVASELAVSVLFDRYYNGPSSGDIYQDLYGSVREANFQVYREGLTRGKGKMGTTLTLALVIGNRVIIGNIGDSRTYLIRQGLPARITHDHSLVQDQIDIGALTPEQAEHSSIRNVITRAIGNIEEVEPDFFEQELEEHDVILLCSDGLHGAVKEQEMGTIVASSPSLKEAAQKLVNLANERGGVDNISVMLIGISELGNPIPPILNGRAAYYPPPPRRQATDPTLVMVDPPTDRTNLRSHGGADAHTDDEDDAEITLMEANIPTKPNRVPPSASTAVAASPDAATQKFVPNPNPVAPKKRNTGLIASLTILVLLVAAAAVYFIINNTSTTTLSTPSTTAQQNVSPAPTLPTVTVAPSISGGVFATTAAINLIGTPASKDRPLVINLAQFQKLQVVLQGFPNRENYNVEMTPSGGAASPITFSKVRPDDNTIYESPIPNAGSYQISIQSSNRRDTVTLNLNANQAFASDGNALFQPSGSTLIMYVSPSKA